MRLLQINSTANWGSTGKIAEQIGLVAMRQGWESYIAYGRSVNPSQSKLIKIGSKLSIYWHVLESRLFDNHGLASRCATRKLIKQIKEIKPDIIHLHNIHGYYLNYKILFKYLNSIDTPVVWTLHDCWAFTGHCSYYIESGCEKFKTTCGRCEQKKVYPKSILLNFAKRNFTHKCKLFTCLGTRLRIVPVSEWLEKEISKSFFKKITTQTIHNGIDINTFNCSAQRTNEYYSNKCKIIGVAAQWTKRKGLDDFISLRNMLSVDDYEIILIGLTQEQIHNLPSGITGLERTNSSSELAVLYSQADVFINPTYADNYPTTNLEALACGTPVITYRTGGSPESVTPQTGFIVEQGDISALAEAIKEIRKKGKEHYSTACRKYAEEHFDKDKCFAKYIELYNKILSER